MSVSFSTGQASRITGVSHRTIDYWAKRELVKPSIKDAAGTGTDREYDFHDLVILRIVGELRNAGASTPVLSELVRFLSNSLRDPLRFDEQRWIALGRHAWWFNPDVSVTSAFSGVVGEPLFRFVINLPRVVDEVRARALCVRASTDLTRFKPPNRATPPAP